MAESDIDRSAMVALSALALRDSGTLGVKATAERWSNGSCPITGRVVARLGGIHLPLPARKQKNTPAKV